MKTSIVLLFAIVFLADCTVNWRHGYAGDSGVFFSTADILNVRRHPNLSAEVIGQLPYGTRVEGRKTDTVSIIGGHQDKWVFLPSVGGFAFGQFLSNQPPSEHSKRMTLYRYSEQAVCESDSMSLRNEKLVLHDGMAELLDTEMVAFFKTVRTEFAGHYQVGAGILKIVFTEGRRTVACEQTDRPECKPSRTKLDKLILQLDWNASIRGYLPHGTKPLSTLDRQWGINKNKCFFALRPYHQRSTLAEMCEGQMGGQTVVLHGYYCTRP